MLSIPNIVDALKELKRIDHTVTKIFSSKCAAAMNFPNSSSTIKDAASCRVAKERYFWEYILATLPVIILMNALVIIAIKTRRRLQSVYNILLACLAGTDLAVALVSQPLFIAQEIFFLSGASMEDYCHFFKNTVFVCLFPCIESLLILALLSMERYIAMKFSLRYATLITTPRLLALYSVVGLSQLFL